MGSQLREVNQRLFDYFAIVGLDPDGSLEKNNIQGDFKVLLILGSNIT